MKIKRLSTMVLVALMAVLLMATGTKRAKADGTLTVWVGSESATFYQDKLDAYATEKNLPFTFDVAGVDTGAAAATYLTDTEAGADIFTIAHDNLGKLLDGAGTIAPVTSDALMDQMEAQNSDSFLNAVYLQAGDGSDAQYYAVPYISQALVLYYNKTAFAGKEDSLNTWEGIMAVAKEMSTAEKTVMATSFMGTDGYNFSAFLLAQAKNEAAKAAFSKGTTLEIYKNGIQANCKNYGDDQVAIMHYAQRFITDPNGRGGLITSNDGFAVELKNGTALTLVGGAWKMGEVNAALGEGNWACVELPSFTLTEADAYGTAKAGMEFTSGTYADCKCFVKKKNSAYADYLDDILAYLTSDAVQAESYVQCANLPSSKTVTLTKAEGMSDGEYSLAVAQTKSAANAGIPQPFGVKAKYNTYYYSAGAPALYEAIVCNTGDAYNTFTAIKLQLQYANYIWVKGKAATDVDELRTFINGKGDDLAGEEKTAAPTPTAPATEPATDPTPAPAKKSGCGSAVTTSNYAIVLLLVGLCVAFGVAKISKKENE